MYITKDKDRRRLPHRSSFCCLYTLHKYMSVHFGHFMFCTLVAFHHPPSSVAFVSVSQTEVLSRGQRFCLEGRGSIRCMSQGAKPQTQQFIFQKEIERTPERKTSETMCILFCVFVVVDERTKRQTNKYMRMQV